MIFIFIDERELLEIKEEFLKEDELNKEIQPNKINKNDVQENNAMMVLPFTEQSSLASTFSPFKVQLDLI